MMDVIPIEFVTEFDGQALRDDMASVSREIVQVADQGGLVLVRNFLDAASVAAIREGSTHLSQQHPANEGSIELHQGCPDIHNWEQPRFRMRDRVRATLSAGLNSETRLKRKLRERDFHSHKFFLWNRHSELFDKAALDVVHLRNALYGNDPEFGIDLEQGFFTVVTVQHYHKGGGFLSEHSEANFHERQGLFCRFEIITLLSKKGVDYKEGGLFARVKGKLYAVDNLANPGDLVIYDVKRPHGCAPVDPRQQTDLTASDGRWMMLVPPYSVADHLRH